VIRNVIAECGARNNRLVSSPELIVVHKTSLSAAGSDNPHPVTDEALDGVSLVRTFASRPLPPPDGLGTCGLAPYHLLVRSDATVEQMLPLSLSGAHARAFNAKSWAIAYVGERPTVYQVRAVERCCALLVLASVVVAGMPARIVGHTSLPGASASASKVCPHEALALARLVDAVKGRLEDVHAWRGDRERDAVLVRAEGLTLA
jgi:hypothetical protein